MKKHQDPGFTLIEAVVTIVVLSIIALSVMHIMIEGFRVWWNNRNFVELRSTGRYTLTRIAAEFREAIAAHQTDSNDIIFDADINNDGEAEEITYSFYDDPNSPESDYITRTEDNKRTWAICHNVKSVDFTFTSPNLLIIDITLSRQDNELKLRGEVTSRCMH